jgi:hypothetical protein
MPTATRPMPDQESSQKRSVVGWARKPREPECCSQELAALVEHVLLDDPVRSSQDRLRDRQPKGVRGLEVDH